MSAVVISAPTVSWMKKATVRYRQTLNQLLNRASEVLALGVDETFSGALAARFEGAVLVQGKHKLEDKRTSIARQLTVAFPSSTFELEFMELQT